MLHEKKAFLKFFIIYFASVALLMLFAGFFYYNQTKNQYLQNEEFSVINFARALKMGESVKNFSKEYNYKKIYKRFEHFDIKNFKIKDGSFIKYIPGKKHEGYLEIFKSTKKYEQKLFVLKIEILIVELLLLLLFALISYNLAKNAVSPLKKSIQMLDKFTKDLIHDLNTPITSIKLNMKLLQKDLNFTDNKALKRIDRSIYTISELYENLTILLEEKTFQLTTVNLFDIVSEVIQIQKQIYLHIEFKISKKPFFVKTNSKAIKQILQNLISNACKYNSKNGYVKIYSKDNALYIEDNGKGIQNPHKIFERSFSENNSSGIGLDIVKRVAFALNIQINVISSSNGTTFILSFH